MKVTLAVELDGGTVVKRTVDVNSSDNPRFWAKGIEAGALAATSSVSRMVEAEYGRAQDDGIHIVRDTR